MKEFYVKIPEEKEQFFVQLLENLNFEFEKLFSSNERESDLDNEQYFTDSDE